jgi:hypothetical protein
MAKTALSILTPRKLLKQMRFAGAQAITDSAFDARSALIAALPKHFTVRNTFTARGFRIKTASKRSANPTAVIGSRRQYLADQVTGASRTRTAQPSAKLRGGRKRVVGKARWPRRLLAKTRHFVAKPGDVPKRLRGTLRSGERLVLRRMGRGGRMLRVQYKLRKFQRIRPRFPFEAIAVASAKQTLERHYKRRLTAALKTAK